MDLSLKKTRAFEANYYAMQMCENVQKCSGEKIIISKLVGHKLLRSERLTQSDTKMYENHVARPLKSPHHERTMPKQCLTQRPFIWFHICRSTWSSSRDIPKYLTYIDRCLDTY